MGGLQTINQGRNLKAKNKNGTGTEKWENKTMDHENDLDRSVLNTITWSVYELKKMGSIFISLLQISSKV